MARGKLISTEKRTAIIKSLQSGMSALDTARKHKVSAGSVYRLNSELKKSAEENTQPNTEPQQKVQKQAQKQVETKAITQTQNSNTSVVTEINQQIALRESEIAVLKNTLSILNK